MKSQATDSSFNHEIARFYDTNLVPLLFEPYATALAKQTVDLAPASVLEIACGTGVATRALATVLPSDCKLTATDLNHSMIHFAKRRGTGRSVSWSQTDATRIPFAKACFDVVVCQFGTMFFADRVAAYREIRRVLRPGGVFLFNVWNHVGLNEFAATVTDALANLFPADPPQFLARTPHAHGDMNEIQSEVRAAGFKLCCFEQQEEVCRATSPALVSLAYIQGTPLRNEIESRVAGSLERVTRAVTKAVRSKHGDGPIQARLSAVLVTAS